MKSTPKTNKKMPRKFNKKKKKNNRHEEDEKSPFTRSITTYTSTAYNGPVAPRWRGILKYQDFFSSDGTIFDYKFNLNSIFDPNLTGGGHQPYGRDTMATLYNRYRVYNCRVTIHANIATSGVVVLVPKNDNIVYTSTGAAIETPLSSFQVSNQYIPFHMERNFNLAQIHGLSHAEYAGHDSTGAAIGADPTEVLVLHVCYSDLTGAVLGNGTGVFLITLEYDVELFDPLVLAQS